MLEESWISADVDVVYVAEASIVPEHMRVFVAFLSMDREVLGELRGGGKKGIGIK